MSARQRQPLPAKMLRGDTQATLYNRRYCREWFTSFEHVSFKVSRLLLMHCIGHLNANHGWDRGLPENDRASLAK